MRSAGQVLMARGRRRIALVCFFTGVGCSAIERYPRFAEEAEQLARLYADAHINGGSQSQSVQAPEAKRQKSTIVNGGAGDACMRPKPPAILPKWSQSR